MMNHEIIFKKQVHELHQLYGVQKSVMNGDSKSVRRELFPMKGMFTESHSLGSTRFVIDDSFVQADQDLCSRFQRRPLDLRLSTGSSFNDDVLDDEEVNLSLSIGRSTNKRIKISEKSWKNKIVYPSPRVVIDLEEESTGTESNEDALPDYSLDQDHLKTDSSLINGGMHQKWSPSNQGSNEWHDVKKTILGDLDLNKCQPDESSFHSNEILGPYPSSDGSFGESCNRIEKPVEVSISTPTSKQTKSLTSERDIQTKAYTIDLESLPEPSSEFTEENEIHVSKVIEQNEKENSDYTLHKAALSLVSISLQRTSIINQDSETKSRSNEIGNNDENKRKTFKRSSSIDSYESLVLKLEESCVDEDSATSKAFEINETAQKEKNGIKLRRGSRLKDFQKDILPTISSLSRHEIWEDINILESVIRSREYKRLNKPKTGKGEKWFTPAKSKRSKVNYAGQRCCLRKKKPTLSFDAEKMNF